MVQVKREFKYWKDGALRFENLYHIRIEGIEKVLCEAIPYLKSVEGRVVDVGCGTGIPDSILEKKLRKSVIGIDFSPSMLKKAKERLQYLVGADALHLAFPTDSLGAIICITVLTDYRNKNPFFREVYSCLRKNGIYVYGDYSLNDEYWNLKEETYPLAFSKPYKLARESIEDIEKELVEEGFTVLDSKTINFKASMTVDEYLKNMKSNRKFKFNPEKEDQVRKIAEEYLLNDELNRELILIISKKD